MPHQTIWLIHYSEIGLKGRNRDFFEQKLIDNIRLALTIQGFKDEVKLKKFYGRIILTAPKSKNIPVILANIFGIAWFAESFATTYSQLSPTVRGFIQKKDFKTFAVRANVRITRPKISSRTIETKLGEIIKKQFNKKVNLDNPDLTVFVEAIGKDQFLIYDQKQSGLRGLPISTGGRFLTLLSGGIDSPVAAFKIMSRGGKVSFVHFHSYPQTSIESVNKAKEIAKLLKKFQPLPAKLFLIPFLKAQKQIRLNVDNRLLVILYRRLMLKISQELANKYQYQALVSGDNLGQVASQTIENLIVQDSAVEIPILRPLITYNKEEIIGIAKKIGTYPISIKPHQDCCTLFIPKHPATKAKMAAIEKEEKKLGIDKLMKEILREIEIVKI